MLCVGFKVKLGRQAGKSISLDIHIYIYIHVYRESLRTREKAAAGPNGLARQRNLDFWLIDRWLAGLENHAVYSFPLKENTNKS